MALFGATQATSEHQYVVAVLPVGEGDTPKLGSDTGRLLNRASLAEHCKPPRKCPSGKSAEFFGNFATHTGFIWVVGWELGQR